MKWATPVPAMLEPLQGKATRKSKASSPLELLHEGGWWEVVGGGDSHQMHFTRFDWFTREMWSRFFTL